MKTVTDNEIEVDETPQENANENKAFDWGSLETSKDAIDLSEYKDLNEDTVSEVINTETDNGNEDLTDSRLYYQSGKKKGQRKPSKNGIDVSFKNPQPKSISGEIISGALFLTVIDLIMPMAIAGLNNHFSKVKIDPEKLTLTDKQKKEFEPLFNSIVKAINFEGNPVLLGCIGLAAVYGMNFMALRTLAKSELEIKRND